MPIRTECPRCGAVYDVPENLLGKTLRCKECEHRWPLEAEAEPSKPAADREDVIAGPPTPPGVQPPAVSTAEPTDLVPAGVLPDRPLTLHAMPPARLVPPDDPKDPLAGRGGPMPPQVLARVKKATLYLRVTMANGQ